MYRLINYTIFCMPKLLHVLSRVVFLGVKELVVKKERYRNSMYRYTSVLHSPPPPPTPIFYTHDFPKNRGKGVLFFA